jgi:hypothetical protein
MAKLKECQAYSAEAAVLGTLLDRRPVLWVGAGLSLAAGIPATGEILKRLRDQAPEDLSGETFPEVVDSFIASYGGSTTELERLLDEAINTSQCEPTARLAAAGKSSAVVTKEICPTGPLLFLIRELWRRSPNCRKARKRRCDIKLSQLPQPPARQG